MDELTNKFGSLLKKRKFSEMVPCFCALQTGECKICNTTKLINKGIECYTCFYNRVDGLLNDSLHNR